MEQITDKQLYEAEKQLQAKQEAELNQAEKQLSQCVATPTTQPFNRGCVLPHFVKHAEPNLLLCKCKKNYGKYLVGVGKRRRYICFECYSKLKSKKLMKGGNKDD